MNDDRFTIFFRGMNQVGKTRFIGRYIEGKSCFRSSNVFDYRLKTIYYNGHPLRLILFEMMGQDYVKNHPPAHNYRRSQGIILLFDVTNRNSLHALQTEIESNIIPALWEKNHPIIYVIGNKTDLENEREVTKEEAQKFSDDYGYKYFECSTLNFSADVNHIMGMLTLEMINQKLLDKEKKPILTEKEIKKNKKCLIF